MSNNKHNYAVRVKSKWINGQMNIYATQFSILLSGYLSENIVGYSFI